ncbi:related to DOA1 - involved in ubiquitin-dependent proteolysis [Ustilago sp. UG-2017b]|nr:related to DOA1 - involved in ubiquitin-dependent proteolysis [Ustilago sp. UG-2017b]
MAASTEAESCSKQDAAFHLTHVLRGHTSDVRSVATTLDTLSGREALLSGSRDETATYWSRSSSSASFDKGATFRGRRFCNAVCFVPPSLAFGLPRGQVLMGNLDSQIRCFEPLRSDKPIQTLSDHWDNISVLKAHDCPQRLSEERGEQQAQPPVFMSGSWDTTARVWVWDPTESCSGKWKSKFVLRGHDAAVWGVQILEPPTTAAVEEGHADAGQGRYLTSSADMFIRLFHGETLHTVYAGHQDVVRSLACLPPLPTPHKQLEDRHACLPPLYDNEQLFASTSNDGTIRIWSLDPRRSVCQGNGGDALRLLKGHTSIVYDLAAYIQHDAKAPRLVSSGEDGTLRVWNWLSNELLQTVHVPVVSVWSIAVLPESQDLVVGCSDGLVRVYSIRPASASAADSNLEGAALSESEAADQAAKAQEVQHRATIEARQPATEMSGEGEQVQGELFQGKRYDFVLQIDVSDHADPLSLPINRGEDRQKVASDFVALHKLPEGYVERIVEFINLVLGSS